MHFQLDRFRFFGFLPLLLLMINAHGIGTQSSACAQTVPFFLVGSGPILGNVEGYGTDQSLIPVLKGQPASDHAATGYSTAGGLYSGDGSFQIAQSLDFTTLNAKFESGKAFQFRSFKGTLACDYGVAEGFTSQTPINFAPEPGDVQLFPIAGVDTPDDPTDDRFVPYFVAEFVPTLDDECTGRFAPGKLTGGSFTMYAIGSPVAVGIVNGQPVGVSPSPGGTLSYTWVGIGKLDFKFPFGLLR